MGNRTRRTNRSVTCSGVGGVTPVLAGGGGGFPVLDGGYCRPGLENTPVLTRVYTSPGWGGVPPPGVSRLKTLRCSILRMRAVTTRVLTQSVQYVWKNGRPRRVQSSSVGRISGLNGTKLASMLIVLGALP